MVTAKEVGGDVYGFFLITPQRLASLSLTPWARAFLPQSS
jgi:hypothetical protein